MEKRGKRTAAWLLVGAPSVVEERVSVWSLGSHHHPISSALDVQREEQFRHFFSAMRCHIHIAPTASTSQVFSEETRSASCKARPGRMMVETGENPWSAWRTENWLSSRLLFSLIYTVISSSSPSCIASLCWIFSFFRTFLPGAKSSRSIRAYLLLP